MSKGIKLQTELNFYKLIMVLQRITSEIDKHPSLVSLSNRAHPIFVAKESSHQFKRSQSCCVNFGQFGQEYSSYSIQKDIKNHLDESTLKFNEDLYFELEFLKGHVPHQAFIIALIYIDRASKLNQTLLLNAKNVLKIAVSCILIAAKFIIDDDCEHNLCCHYKYQKHDNDEISNSYVPIRGSTGMELNMLSLINFEAYVSKPEYDQYQKQLNTLFYQQIQEIKSKHKQAQKKL